MATHPNPDRSEKMMEADHGTVCLITDLRADKYLRSVKVKRNQPPANRLSRPCGGAGGFDDFCERISE